MTIALITVANKGLGHETARRLLDAGHIVLVGARNPERGRRAADELGPVFLEIGPASDESPRIVNVSSGVGSMTTAARRRY